MPSPEPSTLLELLHTRLKNNFPYEKNSLVDDYMRNLSNPLKAEMEAVLKIILSANSKITEDIKWSARSPQITFHVAKKICVSWDKNGQGCLVPVAWRTWLSAPLPEKKTLYDKQ